MDAMKGYCDLWKLKINVSKTKVVVFSRGKVRNVRQFTLGQSPVQRVDDYVYLGVKVNYNTKLNKAVRKQYEQGLKAMYALLSKGRRMQLPVDIMLNIFDHVVLPILLYGSEVWGHANNPLVEKLHLMFCRNILRVNKYTPKCMIYGELGRYPLSLNVNQRLLSYWTKLISGKSDKLSCGVYKLLHNMYITGDYKSPWICKIKQTLDSLGLSYIWQNQFVDNIDIFKSDIKRISKLQFEQEWQATPGGGTPI